MSKKSIRIAALLCAAFLFSAAAPAAPARNAPTVVIVVRHAEKAAVEGDDPPLSEAGQRRSARLAELAAEAGVEAVYTTHFRRTRETARPAAERLKLTPVAVEVTRESAATHAPDLAREILSKHRGRTVLVVGHSNTAPQVAGALAGRTLAPLDDATDFETVFVVVIPETGPARLVRARY
ncbi:MAG TPA: phosphoglycerate mutase family protein [Pyrinomonadaceae bacterium]|nr:phosphoglycerate mutase family protein [Pyrinomonadaceae bacterium]